MKYTFINSVKGGCGKTTAALMWALQQSGYGIAPSCIVDVDLLGTAFEQVLQGGSFVNNKKDLTLDSPVEDMAEVYLNDLSRDDKNFEKNYVSKLNINIGKDKRRLDIVLSSPKVEDKSLFMPSYGNHYMSMISYDYFKATTSKLLRELEGTALPIKKMTDESIEQDIEDIITRFIENFDKIWTKYQQIQTDLKMRHKDQSDRASQSGNDTDDPQETVLVDLTNELEKIKAVTDKKKAVDIFISEYCGNEIYQKCIEADKQYYAAAAADDEDLQGLQSIIEDTKDTIKHLKEYPEEYKNKETVNYSNMVFDMPPNSDPYSDIFMELLLSDHNKDVNIMLVSAINRAQIDANIKWLEGFVKKVMSRKWKLPVEIEFVFNDVSNQRGEDEDKTDEFIADKIYGIRRKFSNIGNNINIKFYFMEYMRSYAEVLRSKECLKNLKIDSLYQIEPVSGGNRIGFNKV